MKRIIRETKPIDITDVMQVMEAAKKIMRSSGNMHQWGEGYPSEAVIMSDIEKDGGFVIEDGGNVVGYFAFLLSPEPTYEKIYDGNWLDDEKPYHVVSQGDRHRVRRVNKVREIHHRESGTMCSTVCYGQSLHRLRCFQQCHIGFRILCDIPDKKSQRAGTLCFQRRDLCS